jgi:hypothetical protein
MAACHKKWKKFCSHLIIVFLVLQLFLKNLIALGFIWKLTSIEKSRPSYSASKEERLQIMTSVNKNVCYAGCFGLND